MGSSCTTDGSADLKITHLRVAYTLLKSAHTRSDVFNRSSTWPGVEHFRDPRIHDASYRLELQWKLPLLWNSSWIAQNTLPQSRPACLVSVLLAPESGILPPLPTIHNEPSIPTSASSSSFSDSSESLSISVFWTRGSSLSMFGLWGRTTPSRINTVRQTDP